MAIVDGFILKESGNSAGVYERVNDPVTFSISELLYDIILGSAEECRLQV